MTTYTLAELLATPTVFKGTAGFELKIRSDVLEVWLSKVASYDGKPSFYEVDIYEKDDPKGRWRKAKSYRLKDSQLSLPGLDRC